MSLDACEYCGTFDAVMWSLKDGSICLPCYDKERAKERQAEIDKNNDLRDFFHE